LRKGGDGAIIRDASGKVTLECTCGLVISGRTDPSMSCFTEGGSFWTNKSNELLGAYSEVDPRTNPVTAASILAINRWACSRCGQAVKSSVCCN